MYDKFRKFSNKWLKEHAISADCIDDWLLGDHIVPYVKTTCVKESFSKKPPYHVYYKYKVLQKQQNIGSAATGTPATSSIASTSDSAVESTASDSNNFPSRKQTNLSTTSTDKCSNQINETKSSHTK